MTISFKLNGMAVTADVKPHHNLVELLQNQFGLTGARESCGQGLCGCCSVVVDGRAVSGCLYLAAFVDGADVRTVEGLDTRDKLSPEQEALLREPRWAYLTPTFSFLSVAETPLYAMSVKLADMAVARGGAGLRHPDMALVREHHALGIAG